MANEKVSQMTSLTAAEVAGGDLFLITDMSAQESKKITASDMLLYIQTTGSFNAITAVNAETASHLLPIGRNITVTSSSYSETSSYSHLAGNVIHADTASFAYTASYVDLGSLSEVATASYLKYTGVPNGTASYSLTSSFVNLAKTSSFLLYTPGLNNGTSSYSISGSFALNCLTASTVSDLNLINATTATSASWASASLTSSYNLGNGIFSYKNMLSYTKMAGTGGTRDNPFPITGLEAKILPKSVNSSFLIILSTVIGQGSTALWKSSSVFLGPLIKEIGSYNGDTLDAITLVTTYVDNPSYTIPVTYSAQVYNEDSGPWYVNRSVDNNYHGTSSLTVIEFGL